MAGEQSQTATELGLQVFVKVEGSKDVWQPAAGRIGIGRVIVSGGSTRSFPRQRVQPRFGGDMLLLAGYTVSPTPLQAGETLTVTLHWRALQSPPGDYQVFVHLLDGAGRLIAQHNGPPRMGLYPTSAWAKGKHVMDIHPVQLPIDYQGSAQPCVGLYTLDSLERLPVTGATEGICPAGSAPLEMIAVMSP